MERQSTSLCVTERFKQERWGLHVYRLINNNCWFSSSCCCLLSSSDSWRDVIRLIMLSQSRGHVHEFMSNQVVVSMETEVAECHVQHLALMANSKNVGTRLIYSMLAMLKISIYLFSI